MKIVLKSWTPVENIPPVMDFKILKISIFAARPLNF